MKILLEGSPLFTNLKTGVGEYTSHITKLIVRDTSLDNFYITSLCFLKRISQKPISGDTVIYRTVRYFPLKVYNLMQRWNLAPPLDLLAFTKADVAIFFNFFRHRLLFTSRSITVIHDLAFYHYPEFIKSDKFAHSLTRAVRNAVAKSTQLVAVSESTKSDLVTHFGASADNVTVISPAVDHSVYKPVTGQHVSTIRKKYEISTPYLLFLGTLEPRKNIVSIIEAYKQLPVAIQKQYQLVLAGAPGWKYEQVEQAMVGAPKGRIILTGFIDEADKPSLYTGATLFLLPSHYEGWGMPVLEAMACGTPVLTAKNSSLSEVGGRAAYYVNDSSDHLEIAGLITKILTDPASMKKRSRGGIKWAQKFTWEKSALKFEDLLKKVSKA